MPLRELSLSFDLISLLLIMLMIQNLGCLFLLYRKRQQGSLYATLLLIAFTLCLLNVYLLIFSLIPVPNLLLVFGFSFGPLIFFMVRERFSAITFSFRSVLAHFFAVCLALCSVFLDTSSTAYFLLMAAAILHFGIYLAKSLNFINQQKSSSVESYRLTDLKHFMLVLTTVYLCISIEVLSTNYGLRFRYSIIVLTLGCFYLWLRYVIGQGKRMYNYYRERKQSEEKGEIVEGKEEKYKTSLLSREKSSALAQELTELMQAQKPYLEEGVSLGQLAGLLNTSPKYLSQVINENFDCNFFDFINTYRIEEAKRKLSSINYQDHKIYEIMYAVGFKSRSSFNTAMKKATGLSPKKYREKHLAR